MMVNRLRDVNDISWACGMFSLLFSFIFILLTPFLKVLTQNAYDEDDRGMRELVRRGD